MPAEQAAGVAARQVCPGARDLQPGAFAQARDGDVVFLQELLDPCRAGLPLVGTARAGVEVVGLSWNGISPSAASDPGSTIGTSLVVRMAGPARLPPALAARYGTPACAACRSGSSTPSVVRVRSSRNELPPPPNTACASATAAVRSLAWWTPVTSRPAGPVSGA